MFAFGIILVVLDNLSCFQKPRFNIYNTSPQRWSDSSADISGIPTQLLTLLPDTHILHWDETFWIQSYIRAVNRGGSVKGLGKMSGKTRHVSRGNTGKDPWWNTDEGISFCSIVFSVAVLQLEPNPPLATTHRVATCCKLVDWLFLAKRFTCSFQLIMSQGPLSWLKERSH